MGEQTKRRPASCVINSLAGRELEFEEQPAKEEKKVLVVGAGIAGLVRRQGSLQNGDIMSLWQKRTESGRSVKSGMPRAVKQEISKWIVYLKAECDRYGVEIRYETLADQAMIKETDPDVVILATGAKPVLLPVDWQRRDDRGQRHFEWKDFHSGRKCCRDRRRNGRNRDWQNICSITPEGAAKVTLIEMAESISQGMVPNNLVPTLKAVRDRGACSGCNRSESEILRTGYGHCGDSGRRGAVSGIYPCSLCRWFQSMESVV
ncbi:MAG: hypothetical protein ACLRMN_09645 [Mediterraneibacter gnavus]